MFVACRSYRTCMHPSHGTCCKRQRWKHGNMGSPTGFAGGYHSIVQLIDNRMCPSIIRWFSGLSVCITRTGFWARIRIRQGRYMGHGGRVQITN